MGKGRTRQRTPSTWAAVAVPVEPGTEPAAVTAGTEIGTRVSSVGIQAAASLRGRRVCEQCC